MQNLVIAGNCGKDAVLRRTQNGDPILSFSMAVDNGKNKDGVKRDATWYDCSIFGKRAESLERYITKGSKLVVSGRPTTRAHEGKAYLGISINELTFMGGGEEKQGSPQSNDGYGAGGNANSGRYMDAEIPFAPEWRV